MGRSFGRDALSDVFEYLLSYKDNDILAKATDTLVAMLESHSVNVLNLLDFWVDEDHDAPGGIRGWWYDCLHKLPVEHRVKIWKTYLSIVPDEDRPNYFYYMRNGCFSVKKPDEAKALKEMSIEYFYTYSQPWNQMVWIPYPIGKEVLKSLFSENYVPEDFLKKFLWDDYMGQDFALKGLRKDQKLSPELQEIIVNLFAPEDVREIFDGLPGICEKYKNSLGL